MIDVLRIVVGESVIRIKDPCIDFLKGTFLVLGMEVEPLSKMHPELQEAARYPGEPVFFLHLKNTKTGEEIHVGEQPSGVEVVRDVGFA